MTTELYLNLCYSCGLSRLDLEDMTIGMCIDFFYEYMEMHKPPKETKQSNVRMASQADFDAF